MQHAKSEEEIRSLEASAEKFHAEYQTIAAKLSHLSAQVAEEFFRINEIAINAHGLVEKLAKKVKPRPQTHSSSLKKLLSLAAKVSLIDKKFVEVTALLTKVNQAAIEAHQKARKHEATISLVRESAKIARAKLAQQVKAKLDQQAKLEAQNKKINKAVYLDGKVTIIDANDFSNQNKLFAKIRVVLRFNHDEVIKAIKDKNNCSFIAFEDDEIVGILLAEKQTIRIKESNTPITQLFLRDIYRPPFGQISAEQIKLMMLLEAMRKAQNMLIPFSFGYESKGIGLCETYKRKENNFFRTLKSIAKNCNVDISKENDENRLSTIYAVQTKNVSCDVRNLSYEKGKLQIEQLN